MVELLLLDRDSSMRQALYRQLHTNGSKPTLDLVEGLDECSGKLAARNYSAVVINAAHFTFGQTKELVSSIVEQQPGITILLYGLEFEKDQLLQLIELGATTYIRGDATADKLLQRLEEVRQGRIPLCPDVAAAIMRRITHLAGHRAGQVSANGHAAIELTRRQQEVLHLIRQGMTNAEIATKLCIEVGTVKNHVHNVLKKLDADDRYEAADRAHLVVASSVPTAA